MQMSPTEKLNRSVCFGWKTKQIDGIMHVCVVYCCSKCPCLFYILQPVEFIHGILS